jgi:hypothetical protein
VLANSPAPKLKTLSLLHRFHVERVLSFGDEAEVGTKH